MRTQRRQQPGGLSAVGNRDDAVRVRVVGQRDSGFTQGAAMAGQHVGIVEQHRPG